MYFLTQLDGEYRYRQVGCQNPKRPGKDWLLFYYLTISWWIGSIHEQKVTTYSTEDQSIEVHSTEKWSLRPKEILSPFLFHYAHIQVMKSKHYFLTPYVSYRLIATKKLSTKWLKPIQCTMRQVVILYYNYFFPMDAASEFLDTFFLNVFNYHFNVIIAASANGIISVSTV